MTVSVRIDQDLYEQAKIASMGEHRTIVGQLAYWAMIGRNVLDNPDLRSKLTASDTFIPNAVTIKAMQDCRNGVGMERVTLEQLAEEWRNA